MKRSQVAMAGAVLLAAGVAAFLIGHITRAPSLARTQPPPRPDFAPPPDAAIPNDAFGREIALGREIFVHTQAAAPGYVGDDLSCESCHLDRGRLANSAPLWGAIGMFPQYRAKNGRVNSFEDRIRGCFRFSMNGKAPPRGGRVLVALESYAAFLAHGAPIGVRLPGAGYPKPAAPALEPDPSRGRTVYADNCALCHGADGQGQKAGGATVFPPLWGQSSYNWGAGMADIDKAAGFIKANMPFSQGGRLTLQEAWDVAAFIDSRPRPQDPRFDGSAASTRAKFHDTPQSMYGRRVDGVLLGGDGPRSRF